MGLTIVVHRRGAAAAGSLTHAFLQLTRACPASDSSSISSGSGSSSSSSSGSGSNDKSSHSSGSSTRQRQHPERSGSEHTVHYTGTRNSWPAMGGFANKFQKLPTRSETGIAHYQLALGPGCAGLTGVAACRAALIKGAHLAAHGPHGQY